MPAATTTITLTIEGHDLPGRSDAVVGLQRKHEVVELVPGDAASATWSVPVTVKETADGDLDVGGPFVHGRRGDRFVYLSWNAVGEALEMLRRAKLHFEDCGQPLLRAALASGHLTCRVGLTDGRGGPTCARVRPPLAEWSAGEA